MNKPATKAAQAERECHILSDDDGFTLTRFVRGEDRMYPDLRLSFRPVMPLERARVMERRRELSEDMAIMALAKIIEDRVTQWNAFDTEGKPLPISIESVCKLHPTLMSRVFAIVIFSTEGGDLDPDRKRVKEQVTEIPDLLASKTGVGGVVEESQKN